LSDPPPPYCCSPEVLEGEQLTQKSDMWVLGVLLYQAVSSMKHPFCQKTQWKMIDAIQNEEP
jgi:serine/threonine protein kinase